MVALMEMKAENYQTEFKISEVTNISFSCGGVRSNGDIIIQLQLYSQKHFNFLKLNVHSSLGSSLKCSAFMCRILHKRKLMLACLLLTPVISPSPQSKVPEELRGSQSALIYCRDISALLWRLPVNLLSSGFLTAMRRALMWGCCPRHANNWWVWSGDVLQAAKTS